MDTIEQVLSLPSHSEVLPSLPRVSARRACPYLYALGMQVRTGPGLLTSTSFPPLSGPLFRGAGAKKKKNPILLISYPSSSLNHDPPFFSPCLFFFL